ncbi:ABC transporter permease [Streptacidiphilus sp. PAMC 29251]
MIGFVLQRLRAQRLLIGAALLTVLFSTCVLATLAGFTSSIGDAGVRRTLTGTDAAATPLLLQAQFSYQERAKAQKKAQAIARHAFPGVPFTLYPLAQSSPLVLPAQAGRVVKPGAPTTQDTASLAALDHSKLRLIQGSWPNQQAAPAGVVPVDVPGAALQRLAAPLGSVLTLHGLIDHRALRIQLVGVYAPRDSEDRYWQLDPLHGKGVLQSGGGATYGPLLLDDRSFGSGAVVQDTLDVLAVPDLGQLQASGLNALAAADSAVLTSLATPPGAGGTSGSGGELGGSIGDSVSGSFTGSSELPSLLLQLQRSVLVSRSTLLVGVLQLTLLALFTLLLAARLLAEERVPENGLLRARGAAPGWLGRLSAIEAALLVLPAVVLSPLLAGPLIRLLAAYGPATRPGAGLGLDAGRGAGLRLDGPLPGAVWWATLLSAAVCALVLLGPTLLQNLAEIRGDARSRARTGSRARTSGGIGARARRAALPGLVRGGVDLALIVLAAAAYWQLDHYAGQGALTGVADGGDAATGGTGGGLGIDPVLVAAPALVLLAGSVTALRLLPLAAHLADRLVSRLRGLPGALVGWQLSRRPQQGAGPIVVLALATAVGILALGQNASWQQSQSDQATFNTGADVRIADTGLPAYGQGGAIAPVPGVAAAVPVARNSLSLSAGRTGELLALDTRTESGLLDWRPDLTHGRTAAQLLRPLADPPLPPAEQGIQLPGRPSTLVLKVSSGLIGVKGQHLGTAGMNQDSDRLRLTLTDRYGLSYLQEPRSVPLDGAVHSLVFDLTTAAGSGVPAYPLTISSISLLSPVSTTRSVRQDFTIDAVRTSQTGAPSTALASVPLPAGFSWSAVFDAGPGDRAVDSDGTETELYLPGRVRSAVSSAGTPLTLSLDSGRVGSDPTAIDPGDPTLLASTVVLSARQPPGRDGPLPAVVDQGFLDATGSRVGSVVALPGGAGAVQIRITAVVDAIPGTGVEAEQGSGGSGPVQGSGLAGSTEATYGGAVLVDLASYDRRAQAGSSGTVLLPSEWWLRVDGAPGAEQRVAQDRVADELRALPDVRVVYTRDDTEAALRTDPLGTGPETALFAAMALAALLAGVGFAMGTVSMLRRQRGETAVLRALGASAVLLARATTARLVLPVLVGMGIGVALGELLTRLVVPLLILTPQAARPTPPLLVRIPGGQLGLLLLAVGTVPLLVAALAGLRSGEPTRVLRDREAS